MANGFMGVTIFFILSGFILTVIYQDAFSRLKLPVLWNYSVARIARIYPLYMVVFGSLMILMLTREEHISRGWVVYLLGGQTWSPNLDFAFAIDAPGWTIGVETFLYIMFPFLIAFFRPLSTRPRLIALLATSTVIVMIFIAAYFQFTGRADLSGTDPESAHRWIYRTPALRLGDFILGMCMGMIYLKKRNDQVKHPFAPWFALGSLSAIIMLMTMTPLMNTAFSLDVLYAVPGAILLLSLALNPEQGIARILGSRPLVMLGEISFAFYLIQIPLQERIGFPLEAGLTFINVAGLLVVLALLIATSLGLHELIERPARGWIRRRASTGAANQL